MTNNQLVIDSESLYNDLAKACKAASYPKVVTCSDKILKSFPDDPYAQQCKVVALIHQEKFEGCLEFFKKQKIKDFHLEKAYCEYRLNRFVDALKTITTCPVDTDGITELRAQIFYRLEEFDKAVEQYEKLMKTCNDDYQEERFTNLIASKAALSCFQGKALPLNYSPALFETAFNAACYCIGRKDYEQAIKYLEEAEELCTETLKDDTDVSEEQIDEELAPIRAQRGYVMQQQQKEDRASEIYHTILRQRSGDPSLMAVVSNNLICINKDQNVFDTKKRIKAASIDGLQHKLFQSQKSSILANQALFYLSNNQHDVCDSRVKAVLNDDPTNVRALGISAVNLANNKQCPAAIKLLEDFIKSPALEELDKQSRLAITLLLLHIHLANVSGTLSAPGHPAIAPLRAGKLSPAMADQLANHTLVDGLPADTAALPLVASLRVGLLLAPSNGDASAVDEKVLLQAKNIVTETLNFWTKKGPPVSSDESVDSERLLARCIDFFRFHGFAEDAAHLLEQRLEALKHSQPTGDKKTTLTKREREQQRQSLLALLIQAYAKFDHAKASDASRELEFKEKLSEKEVDSLEATFLFNVKSIKKNAAKAAGAATPKSGGVENPGSGSGAVAKQQQYKKKKKRKVRLPKNYEPGVPPDPERWLPKRERIGFRGKRRDKRQAAADKNLGRGPQGVSVAAAPELDMANAPAPATSTPPGSGPNNAQRRPLPQKPHKKKGKKR